MPENVVESETPDSLGESTLHVAKKCLKLVDTYRKGSRIPLEKAAAIRDITTALTSGTPQQFPESEVNNALGSYLRIIEQHDKSVEVAASRSDTADEHSVGSKRAGSLEPVVSTGKRQKLDETEFPWSI
jgi:hypothetical protein